MNLKEKVAQSTSSISPLQMETKTDITTIVGPGIKMQKVHRYRVLKGNLEDESSKPTGSSKKPVMMAGPPQGSPAVAAPAASPAVSNEAESSNEDEDAILKEE